MIMKFICYTVKSDLISFVRSYVCLTGSSTNLIKTDHRTKYLNRTVNETLTGLANWQTWIYQRFLYLNNRINKIPTKMKRNRVLSLLI